jgi:limonene-1,2-epoxide hydrolase
MWVQNQLSSPSITVEDFYSALHQQDYQTAYSKFSTEAQNSLSESRFEQTMSAADLVSGGVETYSIVTATTSGSTATVTVDVVRRGDTTMATVFQLTLVQEQQTWRISTIQQKGQTAAPTPSS